jgi:hypothetical protein
MPRDESTWSMPLRRIPGGEPHLPDPVDAGDLPGREPPATMLEGVPLGQAGFPELQPDAYGPLWLSAATLRAADPLVLPSNPTGGPILECDLALPDSGLALSGARLTHGPNASYTEEVFLARPAGSNLFRFFYGDHKAGPRYLYQREFGENLLARLDRGVPWGGLSLGWQQNLAKVVLAGDRQLLWNFSGLNGGGATRVGPWSAELTGTAGWERFVWTDPGRAAVRKSSTGRALLHLRGPGIGLRPLATVQVDYQHLRFNQLSVFRLDQRRTGLGFAAGMEGVSGRWRGKGSVGRAAPGPRRAGWIAALEGEGIVSETLRVWTHADRSVRAPLLPRLGNELGTMVGQGVCVVGLLPGSPARFLVDPNRPLEEIRRAEAGVSLGPAAGIGYDLTARVCEIHHAISAEGGLLSRFSPNGYYFLPSEALDRTVRVASLRLGTHAVFPYGFRLEAWAAGRTSKPGWRDQLWMTPWEGQGRLAWSHRFFQGDLWAEGYLRGVIGGERATPQGVLTPSDRIDGGLTFEVDRLSLFVLLSNMEDDIREAAAYDGGWVYLPRRSYRTGLTWRFVD